MLQTLGEGVAEFVACQDELAQAALIKGSLSLVIDNVSLVLEYSILRLVLMVVEIGEQLPDLLV